MAVHRERATCGDEDRGERDGEAARRQERQPPDHTLQHGTESWFTLVPRSAPAARGLGSRSGDDAAT
jgi:hypothetical protein